MDLAIIVVSYNTRKLLADCLQSAFAGLERSSLSGEVWVVDNASTDGSAEMVCQRFPQVNLVAHDKNLGFAAGNNLALRAMGFPVEPDAQLGPQSAPETPGWGPARAGEAIARTILFLNPDTRVVGDALGAMFRFLDTAPEAGAVGARLVHADGSFQHSAFAFPGLIQIFLDFFPLHHRLLDSRLNGRYARRLYESGQPFRVGHPLGAALMVRAGVLAQVGGFDERFFMYCEEVDLCQRIHAAGREIYCVPESEIVHLGGQSTRQARIEMFVALWRSRFLMYDKHNSPAFGWAARRLVRVGLWAEARKAKMARQRGEIAPAELDKRLAAFQEVAAF